jgi:hypothetical protein
MGYDTIQGDFNGSAWSIYYKNNPGIINCILGADFNGSTDRTANATRLTMTG